MVMDLKHLFRTVEREKGYRKNEIFCYIIIKFRVLFCVAITESFYSVKYGLLHITSFIPPNNLFHFMSLQMLISETICNIGIFYTVLVLFKEKILWKK